VKCSTTLLFNPIQTPLAPATSRIVPGFFFSMRVSACISRSIVGWRGEICVKVCVCKRPDATTLPAVDAPYVLLPAKFANRHIQTRSGLRLVVDTPARADGLKSRDAFAQFVNNFLLIHGMLRCAYQGASGTYLLPKQNGTKEKRVTVNPRLG
jgi:hypothetical protein